tara:strand:+ start:123 stop:536 length:414 start_codon:yes stop_codon:yes gene_type:complete
VPADGVLHKDNICRGSCSSQNALLLHNLSKASSPVIPHLFIMKKQKHSILEALKNSVYEDLPPQIKDFFDNITPQDYVQMLDALRDYGVFSPEIFDLLKTVILEQDGKMTQEQYREFVELWYEPSQLQNFGKKFTLH